MQTASNIARITGIIALCVIAISFLFPQKTFDLHFHDTYLVMAWKHPLYIFSFFMVITWAVYRFNGNNLWSWRLFTLHTFLLIFSALAYIGLSIKTGAGVSSGELVYNDAYGVLFLFFLLALILLVVNVVAGLFRVARRS